MADLKEANTNHYGPTNCLACPPLHHVCHATDLTNLNSVRTLIRAAVRENPFREVPFIRAAVRESSFSGQPSLFLRAAAKRERERGRALSQGSCKSRFARQRVPRALPQGSGKKEPFFKAAVRENPFFLGSCEMSSNFSRQPAPRTAVRPLSQDSCERKPFLTAAKNKKAFKKTFSVQP